MIKAGVGYSTQNDTERAAEEATKKALEGAGISRADWALLFPTFTHRYGYERALEAVSKLTGTSNISGCSAIGTLTTYGEVEGSESLVVMVVASDTVQAIPFLVSDFGDGGRAAGLEIGGRLKPHRAGKPLLAVFPDPFRIHSESLIDGIETRLGKDVPIVGASASEHPASKETYQFGGDTVTSGAVSGFMLSGSFSYTIDITQGCQPIGKPCIVTKAQRNLIMELNGRPAFEVMQEQVPWQILENPRRTMYTLFIGLPTDPRQNEIAPGEYLVRNLIGFDPDKGIVGVAAYVPEGQLISFTVRQATMAREDLKEMLERVARKRQTEKPFKFGFYFNCCARGTPLYGYSGIDTAYITHVLGEIPIIGFFGNSELAPLRNTNYLFTYTGVLVLISEE